MSKLDIRNLAIGIIALVLLIFSFNRSQVVNMKDHDQYIETLRTLQYLDVSFKENILESRYTQPNNYAPIVANLLKMREEGDELFLVPSFIELQSSKVLQGHLDTYIDLLTEREILTDRFKSENDILHNSLSFFPFAAPEFADEIDATNKEMAIETRNLLQLILTYNLHPQEELQKKIKEQIENLNRRSSNVVDDVDVKKLHLIVSHAETILKYKNILDSITFDLLNLPTKENLQKIYVTYYNTYLEKLATANAFRLALYLISILLLAVIAYTIIALRTAKQSLNSANETLDGKVRDRTEKLNAANAQLTEKQDQLTQSFADLKEAHKKLQKISIIDELTGLYTRRFLFEWMEKQVNYISRNPGTLGCLMLDIDFFKSFNDAHGHGEGDKVLQKIAGVISQVIRQGDIVGRIDGEEFLILLPDTDLDEARIVAERIRAAIEMNIKTPGQITASIGVGNCSCLQPTKENFDTDQLLRSLLDFANQALSRAKENGGNQARVAKRIRINNFHS